MARKVRVKALGRVTLPILAEVASAFSDLLEVMTKLKSGAEIEWVLENAKFGSIDFFSIGFPANKEADLALDEIYSDYIELARGAVDGVLDDQPPAVIEQVARLARVSRYTHEPVFLGVGDDEADLLPILSTFGDDDKDDLPLVTARKKSRTSVRGTIVTCDDKSGTYFTLQACSDGKNIRCYPDFIYRGRIAEYWASKVTVLVEGVFTRYTKNPTLTNITTIVPLGTAGGDEWRIAIGSAPAVDRPAMTTDEAIRRFRNG